MKKIILILFLLLPSLASAAGPCVRTAVRWSGTSNRIYISGDVACTLSEIKSLSKVALPIALVGEKTWFLGANLFVTNGATLVLHSDQVSELRLKSNSNSFVSIEANWGNIDIDGVKITSWDETTNSPDIEYATTKRAYIRARSFMDSTNTPRESRMDIKNSEVCYLGYNSSEAYGLSWKVLGSGTEIFNSVGVFGEVSNNKIHDNYFGYFSFGAEAIKISNNEFYNNVKYGVDPHDDSDNLLIDNNDVHNNGYHGIICSKRCDHIQITNNKCYLNAGNGIMIHRMVVDSIVAYNNTHDNKDSGIAIFDSYNNEITNNISVNNGSSGLRLSVGSASNTISNNDFSNNKSYGIYFYQGSDAPTLGDGRIVSNDFSDNTINGNLKYAVKLQQGDNNNFSRNTLDKNIKGVYLYDTNNNNFIANNLTSDYYSEKISKNNILDSDTFSIRLSDSISTMSISDSTNDIFKNSKNIFVTAYPTKTLVSLTSSNAGTSVVSFSRLNFSVKPNAGTIKIVLGSTSLKWTETSAGATSAEHIIGGLTPNTSYSVLVNGVSWKTLKSDTSGKISFVYNPYTNSKTFEIK